MKRLDMALTAILMLCAFALINAQHRARMLFVELESLKKEARELEVDWGKLKLEQSTLADPQRVESVAQSQLGLALPAIDRIVLLEARP